jgi:phage terminase large subunit-like protein
VRRATGRSSSEKHLPPAEAYARDAAEGYIVCSREVQLAARRHLRDLAEAKHRGLVFDQDAAQFVLDFFPFLCHTKGERRGEALLLEPWQQFILWVTFGWRRIVDGLRRFRTAYVEVARKNGKTTLMAGLGLYFVYADGEPGAEVYCAATKKDQARLVFDIAVEMRERSKWLKKDIAKFRDNLNVPATGSKFQPLSSDEDTLDGLNVHAAIVDELHAHKTRTVWDVLATATAARRQPMMWAITTAGFDRESICWKQHEYAEKILEGVQQDDSFFAFIATVAKEADWEDEENWKRANPNLGVSVKLEDLRAKAATVKIDPSGLNTFLRLHLNQWTQTDVRWLKVDDWNASARPEPPPGGFVIPEDPRAARQALLTHLAGRRCYGGLDLSATLDLTACVLLFPPAGDDPRWFALPWFWVPEENIEARVKSDRVPYDQWVREGWIEATDGNVVDYETVRQRILALRDRYRIEELAVDPWNSTETDSKLGAAGMTVVDVRQGVYSMAAPTKALKTYVFQKILAHAANPVLRWQAANVVVRTDANGNETPNKAKVPERIDGIVALIMALSRCLPNVSAPPRSVYSTRGLATIG